MTITTLSSREFNQHASHAKRMAEHGPVFITDRGRPAHVLLSIADYQQLAGTQWTILEALSQVEVPDFEFEPARSTDLPREVNLL